MNKQWQQWMEARRGRIDEKGGGDFPDASAQVAAVRNGEALALLDNFRLIRVEGEDALSFLQGQLSSDIRELEVGKAQYSTYSNAKGRMLASFLVWQCDGIYYLVLSADIAEAVARRLSMFIMRSKVKLTLMDADQFVLAGARGDSLQRVILQHFGAVEINDLDILSTASETVISLPCGGYFLLLSENSDLQRDLLQQSLTLVSPASWAIRDIDAGIAWVVLATQEQFVPQMANMELIGAVSFKKGCYPGQEIVARTQYLGKLKRRLFRVVFPHEVAVGSKLYSPELQDQAIGMVASVCPVENSRYEGLVVVQSACWEKGVYLEPEFLHSLKCLDLPYSTQDK